MELLPQYQQDLSALGLLFVRSHERHARAAQCGRDADARASGPVTINHSGQLPSVTISFNLAPGVSLGAATGEMQRLATQNLPSGDHDGVLGHGAGVSVDAGGTAGRSSFSRSS